MRTVFTLLVFSAVSASALASTPPEQVARDFFRYLVENDITTTRRDINSDSAAQQRFLSSRLRDALQDCLEYHRTHPPKDGEISGEPPNNASFLLAWDPPKLFKVNRTTKTPYTAIVAGRCIWVKGQQYEYEVRPTFFILRFERGEWRVDDVQAAKANFNPDMSLFFNLTSP